MDTLTVVYFSMEFAIGPDMPTYSAGPDVGRYAFFNHYNFLLCRRDYITNKGASVIKASFPAKCHQDF